MASTCDLLIIGGGVIGVSVAFHLARRRVGRVVLLEKAYLGAGSSGKSGAIVRTHYSNPLTAAMALRGLRTFEHFPDEIGGPPVFTRTGLVHVVNQRDRAALDANLALQRGLGIDARPISALELMDLDPNARLAEDEVAAYESEAGYVEAVQAVASFAEAARKRGADVRQGVEVQAIAVEKGKVVGVETNEGPYQCGTVVLATGPWAARLAGGLGVPLPVQACRTQVALFRRPTDCARRGAVYFDFVQGLYFKPTFGDVLHAGSLAGEELQDPVDPDHYNEAADGTWLPGIRQRLSRRYPAMHRGYGRGGFGALYGITPDWHPVLDRLPGIEGAYCAVGFSGHGFKLAPVVGQLLAELIVDGKTTTLDVGPLRLTRFADNEPIQMGYSYGVIG
jgi:sarcosine oxidase subunit beta